MSSRGTAFAALGAAFVLLTLPAYGAGPASATGPDDGAPPGAEVLGRPAVGEPFTLTIAYSDTPKLDEFEVTVDEVRCGEPLDPKVLAHAADSATGPTPAPTPEEGKQYCVLSMEVLNVGKSEADWSADGATTLNVGDTAYSPTESDTELARHYARYWSDQGKSEPSAGINPGSKGPTHGVFQIPAADKPTTVWVASAHLMETINGVQPGYLVQLNPSN
ncbi:hypothetical protein ACIQPT_14655 [Streptomyces sp. NPDC091289]|uniref:hypothetical protein n=1 Tax=Streptomyces sp. NPDC091289 TaxID=3365989 RepID=UPI00380DCFFB